MKVIRKGDSLNKIHLDLVLIFAFEIDYNLFGTLFNVYKVPLKQDKMLLEDSSQVKSIR